MNINLEAKDGSIHAFMFRVRETLSGVEEEFNKSAEEYLSYIKNEGYEIVDIKFSPKTRGGNLWGYTILVLYK